MTDQMIEPDTFIHNQCIEITDCSLDLYNHWHCYKCDKSIDLNIKQCSCDDSFQIKCNKLELKVDIDFDRASKAWRLNKIGSKGYFKYICGVQKTNNKICRKTNCKYRPHVQKRNYI
jgi:hypothetical protein